MTSLMTSAKSRPIPPRDGRREAFEENLKSRSLSWPAHVCVCDVTMKLTTLYIGGGGGGGGGGGLYFVFLFHFFDSSNFKAASKRPNM